jgi:hypothetical protein
LSIPGHEFRYNLIESPNPSLSLMSDKFRIAGSVLKSRLIPILCPVIPLTPIVSHDIDRFHQ